MTNTRRDQRPTFLEAPATRLSRDELLFLNYNGWRTSCPSPMMEGVLFFSTVERLMIDGEQGFSNSRDDVEWWGERR